MGITRLIVIAALAAIIGACASGPVVIQEGLTPAELIQRAQDLSDRNRYSQAAQYYQAILERYPGDLSSVCAAEYEIAFILYKQKRYEESKAAFRALLARYNQQDAELLPPQFKILSEKVLGRMELDKK